ncbi:MAG: tRNA1(Val) (adenine(37)-N6)-methyltransferase [Nitrospiraceae bacterium]|nr:tRNA1(Val) (adenine(37)-N6)-methyltransferase [Nitrospiraceae bacterium]
METTLDWIRDIRLYQHKNGYRFSVDALLLYAFVNMKHVHRAVDLGTGSGIIGLLVAKKYAGARVQLVELQESLYRLAARNIGLNGLGDRVSLMNADIKEVRGLLEPHACDLVVSNPPFRKPATGRISCGEEKAVARHELKIKLPDLAGAASWLLKGKGRFFMIFHPDRLIEVIDTLREHNLEPKRLRFVHNDTGSVSKIFMIEAVKDGRPGLKLDRPLFLYGPDGNYTEEVRRMYDVR